MNKTLRRGIILIYVSLSLRTLFLVFGMQRILNVTHSKDFPLENAGFFMIGVAGIILLFRINDCYGKRIELFLQKKHRLILLVSLGGLLVWQLYSCYGGYFLSEWDAGVIRETVRIQFNREYAYLDNGYFSWWPNNMFLVWIFTTVLRFATSVGYSNWKFSLVVFQCVIDVVSIWLVYRVTIELTKNQRVAFLTYAVAFLFVGVSPWFIVAYSDATGIALPILIIRLYQLSMDSEKRVAKTLWSIALGFVSVAGYFIKPQILIAFIAVVLTEICCLIGGKYKRRLVDFSTKAMCYAAGMITFVMLYNNLILPELHFQINSDTTFGWQYYFMMGLNASVDGAWSADDYNFTQAYPTNAERNEANLQEAKRRIKEMGIGGLFQHLCRKQLVNYGDGTFAWNVEGKSFAGDPEWAQNRISSFIRSLIKPEGENYIWFISSKQLIWVMVLFFLLFVFAYPRGTLTYSGDKSIMVMVMSVIGLTVFELLFEARARYLFCYAPLYVILSGWGLRNVYCNIRYCFRNFAAPENEDEAGYSR